MERRDFLRISFGGVSLAVFSPDRVLAAATDSEFRSVMASRDDSASTKKRWVYLTFDDGPGTGTNLVRPILEREQVPASFFIVGARARKQTTYLKSLVRDGHSIQNHSWTHPDLTKHPNPRRELLRCRDFIADAVGEQPACFRPPYGATNKRIRNIGQSLEMKEMLWNLSATPPLAHKDPPRRFRERIDEVLVKSNYIVTLFHDGSGDVTKMSQLLPEAIAGFKERGFSFAKF